MRRDDNDRLLDGGLPKDAFADATPVNTPPRMDRLLRWQPFPVSIFPEPCHSFVVEASAALGCDATYVALPLLVALAGCIGNLRRILLKPGWIEPAVIWAAVVGRSGTLKSPAQQIVFSPLHDTEIAAIGDYRTKLAGHDRDLERWKEMPKKERGEKPEVPAPPERLLMSEATVEAVAACLEENPRGLILTRDELAGWLGGFDMYRGGRGGDVQKWIEMHGARPLIVDRKSGDKRTICVANAAVSVTGGVQPEVLREVLGRKHFYNGLASRLLMAMPPDRPKRWSDAQVAEETTRRIEDQYRRLRSLHPGMGEGDRFMPIDIPLSLEAREHWIPFYERHADRQAEAPTDALAASFAKLEGYAARFGLVLHAVRHLENLDDRVGRIGPESILGGITLAEWFVHEQERVYSILRESGEQSERRRLVESITARSGRMTVRELMQASRRYRDSAETAEAALDDLVAAGLGRWEDRPPGPRGGQPTREFVLFDAEESA